jgi:phosphoserine phosphatase
MASLPLIVFDVNETLLDLETMEPTFARIFGEKSAIRPVMARGGCRQVDVRFGGRVR